MILFCAFAMYPMADVIYLSFYHYNLIQPPSFAGFANYRQLISDPEAIASCVHTLEYCALTYVPTVVISLSLALAVNTRIRGAGIVRTLWFIPFAMSWVAVAVLWNLIFQPQGLLDAIIRTPVYWVTTSSAAPFAVAIMSIWKQIGFFMMLFLAGLQRIPAELYGAASVDGAGPIGRFRNVTVPQLRPTLLLVGIIAIYYGLTAFDPMYVLTGGGPANSTETLSLFIFKTAFEYGEMGQASALAVPLFLVLLVIGVGQWMVYRRRGGE
jgi:ABC-type sugar transport system permease subunit